MAHPTPSTLDSDRLQQHGIQNHGNCVFCFHSMETIDHLLVGCVVTSQIWSQFFARIGLRHFSSARQISLADFCAAARGSLQRKQKTASNSCIILASCMIWKERNSHVFRQESTSVDLVLQRISDEFSHWHLAGAHCLEALPRRE